MPRPAHKPTRDTRTQVRTLAGIGISQKMICKQIGIGSEHTLEKHYRKELDEGMATAVINMAKSFYLECLNGKDWRAKLRWLRLFGGPQWDDTERAEIVVTGLRERSMEYAREIGLPDEEAEEIIRAVEQELKSQRR